MLSTILNKLASGTKSTKQLLNEVAEFRALKTEINKARCVLELNADGMITNINANLLVSLGYSDNELTQQHHRMLISRVDSTSVIYQDFWANLTKGQAQTGKFKLLDKQQQEKWFQGYYAPVLNQQKQLIKVVAYLTDISQDMVKVSDAASEEAAINQTFGVMVCDMQGNILECNDLFVKPLGYQKDELVGHHVSVFLPANLAQSADYKKMWAALNQGELCNREIKRISKNGTEYWFKSTYVPILDATGKANKVIVYSFCITAEKLKAAENESQLTSISRTQGVIEFDLNGNILKANDNFINVVGYSREEIIGKHHSMFVDTEYKQSPEYKAFWDKLKRGEYEISIYKRIGKNNKEIWLQASYNPIHDMNGNLTKVIKYASDITERHHKDEEEKITTNEAILIKNTLDGASTNMMMANNDGIIMYMNKATQAFMRKAQSDMRKSLPNFDAEKIVGQNFDIFHKSPSHQRNLLASLSKTYETTIPVGTSYFKLIANPIFFEDSSRHGTSLEWIDVTQERNLEIELSEVLERAAGGDLTKRVNLSDKVGVTEKICAGINVLIEKMTEVMQRIKEAGETINTAAEEISSGNSDLSNRTEQQASSLEETAASMEELAATVKQNAENAKQANQLAAAASSVAVKGGQVVGNVVNTMSAINDSARKIENIISVIDGIAFQTNILALNAAVEAARAGEQGRGFAVVAGEVRNLAQRSASAAKEIKELISTSVSKVEDGTKLVEDAGRTMEEIVSSVQRVTDIMGEITAASSEQSTGINQVNNAITTMDEATQQNAALVEEAAAAAESLVDQAVSLMDVVNEFTLQSGRTREPQKFAKPATQGLRAVSSAKANTPIAKPISKTVAKVSAKTGTDNTDWEEF